MFLEEIDKRIRDLYKEWSSLQPLDQENSERLWRNIRLEWNYNSNRIEGNVLTYNETELLLIHGRAEGGHSIRDYEEMKAHDAGIKKVREFAEDRKRRLTEVDIRDLNRIILKEPFWKEAKTLDGQPARKQVVPGRYKIEPNHVKTATGEIFKFALPEEVPAKMEELMKWFNDSVESPPTSIVSFLAELHHRFIIIHPFDDGNGRIVRLWMNYALMQFGYPPLVIKSEDREGYISALQKSDTGNIGALAIYLGRSLISWLEIGTKAARGEDISEYEDIDKEVDIFIRSEKAKGLEGVKSLSREDIEELYQQSWIPLFEGFENQFKQFNQVFSSTKTTLLHEERPASLEDFKKNLENRLENQEENFTEGFRIFYEGYKIGSKPFHMEATLSIKRRPYDFEYEISIRPDPKISLISFKRKSHPDMRTYSRGGGSEYLRSKAHARAWTKSEIGEFVAEGKKDFLEILKNMTEKTTDKEG